MSGSIQPAAQAASSALAPGRAPDRARGLGRGPLLALLAIALTTLWFWVVAVHRIDGHPWEGFAPVFTTNCGDFEHFYFGARALREGTDLYASGVHGYIYPPLIAFLYMPLTAFDVKTAALIMLVVNIAFGLACTWLVSAEVARRLEIDAPRGRVLVIAAVTLLLACTKLRSEFQMWQTNVLMMLALLLAFRFLDARPRLAGLLLGAAVNVKYLPLVFIPYLLLRRRYRAATWSAIGIVAFALLPAVQSGWQRNLQHWQTALSGLARLLGLAAPVTEAANIDPITVGHSISITSALSRLLDGGASPLHALAVAAAVAAAVVWLVARAYADARQPLLRWPRASAQFDSPYRGMIAIEWAGLMAFVLAFSPQTNPRHTSLLLMSFAPLAAMLCYPRAGGSRRPALAAAAILFLGLVLPPNIPQLAQQLQWWRTVGGAGWSMAVMLPFLFTAGLRYIAAGPQPQRFFPVVPPARLPLASPST